MREEHAVRVFESRVLGKIFGHNSDGVTGEWRKLHNEELNDLFCSPNVIRVLKLRRMGWVVKVARMGKRRGAYRVFVCRPE